eukprot:SAG22_NODE_1176_length_5248_cov_3.965819_3_plen_220_part_00
MVIWNADMAQNIYMNPTAAGGNDDIEAPLFGGGGGGFSFFGTSERELSDGSGEPYEQWTWAAVFGGSAEKVCEIFSQEPLSGLKPKVASARVAECTAILQAAMLKGHGEIRIADLPFAETAWLQPPPLNPVLTLQHNFQSYDIPTSPEEKAAHLRQEWEPEELRALARQYGGDPDVLEARGQGGGSDGLVEFLVQVWRPAAKLESEVSQPLTVQPPVIC